MDWETFTIGFWHPFGPHGGTPDGPSETAEEILLRKGREIEANGWTLWSFQYRTNLERLVEIIQAAEPSHVYALCADAQRAVAPRGQVRFCRQYQLAGTNEWQDIPSSISIPNPMGQRIYACAFKVRRITELADQERQPAIGVEWFSTRTGLWSSEYFPGRIGYPPKPEFLIRRSDNGAPLRPVRALLELEYPFLATLR